MILNSETAQTIFITIGLLISILLSTFLPAKTLYAQSTNTATYTFEECDRIEEDDLRKELKDISQAVFEGEESAMNVGSMVEHSWTEQNLDQIVDEQVDLAKKRVHGETPWWDRVKAIWSEEYAERLTTDIITYTVNSEAFSEGINAFATNLTAEISAEIHLMTVKSASTAFTCVQTFIGSKFSDTLATTLYTQIKESVEELPPPDPESEDFFYLDILKENPDLVIGVGSIVGGYLAKNLAKELLGKFAGKIVARILGGSLPIVGWLVGAFLIIKDIFDAGSAALDVIATALKDDSTKAKIREHFTREVREELRTGRTELARVVSDDVFSQWQKFQKKYARVLDLAERDPQFRTILDNTAVNEVEKLANLATLIENRFGLEKLRILIGNGQFERLLLLSEEVLDILEVVENPEVVIAWADLAEEKITQVVLYDVYRVSLPSDFRDRAQLESVLSLEDTDLIRKVMMLDPDSRYTILELSAEQSVQVLAALSPEALSHLSEEYLAVLEPREKNILVDRILRNSGLQSEIGNVVVRDSLLEGQYFEERLNYIVQRTRDRSWFEQAVEIVSAAGPVLSGTIPLALFFSYDGIILLNMLYWLVGIAVIYFVFRRLSPRRGQGVTVTVNLPQKPDGQGGDRGPQKNESHEDEGSRQ